MCLLLLLLLRYSAGVFLAQSAADRTCLFRAQVEGQVFLLGIEEAQLVALVGIDDCEDPGNGFSEIMSAALLLAVVVLLKDGSETFILVNFDEAPPAIFCTLNDPSSVFNSSSCFFKSSLFLDQSVPGLMRAELVDCAYTCQ